MDMRALFEKTAEKLTGKVIYVRFRYPPSRGSMGECYRTADHLTHINIVPGLGIEKAYKILLHETAHALLHVHDVAVTDTEETASGSYVRVTEYPVYHADNREVEARALTERWMQWADEKTKNVLKNENSDYMRVVGKLTALQYYTR